MGVVIPVGWAEATVQISLLGDPEPMSMVWGIGPADIDPEPSVAAILAGYVNNALTQVGSPFDPAVMYERWTYVGTRVAIGSVAGPVLGEEIVNLPGEEPNVGQPPVNTSLLISKNTSLGGRRGRGRIYAPLTSIGSASVEPTGIIATAAVANLQAWWTQALEELTSNGADMYLFHSAPEVGPAVPPTKVTSLSVQTRVATQRTRMRS